MWPTMPFGKHAGVRLTEIPTDYLRWCVTPGNLTFPDGKYPGLREQLKREYYRRNKEGRYPDADYRRAAEERNHYQGRPHYQPGEQAPPPPPRPMASNASPDTMLMIIQAGRAALAKRFHPDISKDPDATENMKAVNIAADWLESAVRALPGK
jgi:hypothetical protein